MDKLQEIKQYRADVIYIEQDDIDWLIKEVEHLRTIEQAYNALRSAL